MQEVRGDDPNAARRSPQNPNFYESWKSARKSAGWSGWNCMWLLLTSFAYELYVHQDASPDFSDIFLVCGSCRNNWTARGSCLQGERGEKGGEGGRDFCPAPGFQRAPGEQLSPICRQGAPPAAGTTPSRMLLGQAGAPCSIFFLPHLGIFSAAQPEATAQVMPSSAFAVAQAAAGGEALAGLLRFV